MVNEIVVLKAEIRLIKIVRSGNDISFVLCIERNRFTSYVLRLMTCLF